MKSVTNETRNVPDNDLIWYFDIINQTPPKLISIKIKIFQIFLLMSSNCVKLHEPAKVITCFFNKKIVYTSQMKFENESFLIDL